MAGATILEAQAEAMKSAAENPSTGPMFGLAGVNMAASAGGARADALFAMGRQQAAQAAQAAQAPQAAPAPQAASASADMSRSSAERRTPSSASRAILSPSVL